MLLVVYRSIVTTLIQLFLTFIGLLTARGVVSVLATHGAFGLTTFAGNILTMLAIAAATDYGIFIFGRYREDRGIGLRQGRLLLRHLQVRRARHRGFGPDDRRGDVLPQLRAAALLLHHGRPGRDRHGRGRGDCGHARPGRAVPRQPGWAVRIQTPSAEPVLAPGRHRRGPLAGTGFRGEPVRGADRHRGHSRIQAGLQRPLLPADGRPDRTSASPPPTGTSRKPG